MRSGLRRNSASRWQRWADMYVAGHSQRDIAAMENVSEKTLRKVLKKLSIQPRPAHRPVGTTRIIPMEGLQDFRHYRRAWRTDRKIERMMSLAAPRKSRFAA